jgi:hypothetical protein
MQLKNLKERWGKEIFGMMQKKPSKMLKDMKN